MSKHNKNVEINESMQSKIKVKVEKRSIAEQLCCISSDIRTYPIFIHNMMDILH